MSAIENEVGVGQCPERPDGFGHIWAGTKPENGGNSFNPCRFCDYSGRRFFREAITERMERHGRLAVPMQSGTGSVSVAWPKGQPEAMAAKAAEIVADKKERDRIARESGVGRPGQLRGSK